MAKIKRLIPFGWHVCNWGLTGRRRQEALAEYYWDGEDLDYQLLEIRHEDKESREYRTAKLRLDYRYHKIGEFDYGLGLVQNDDRLTENARERELARYLNRFGRMTGEEMEYRFLELSHDSKVSEAYLKEKLQLDVRFGKTSQEQADHVLLDLRHSDHTSLDYLKDQAALELRWGNIDQNQYEKEIATLNREPWFNFVGADRRISGDTIQAAVELDWNEFFVTFLEQHGWTGSTADEVVDRWFEDMMRQQLNIFDDGLDDDGSQDPMPMASQNRTPREDGLTEYR